MPTAGPSDDQRTHQGGVSRAERLYFVAVGVLAGWVGLPAFLAPARVDKVLPFGIPPLHARVVGAVYLAGLAIMVRSAVARRWKDIRVVPLMTAIWTGGLLLVTLLHHGDFDFTRTQTQVWFAAYVAYPVLGVWILVSRRRDAVGSATGRIASDWVRRWLVTQGIVLILVGAALFLAPGTMAEAWPWPVQSLLAQIYSAPLMSFGVGSVLLSRFRTEREMRVGVLGLGVFAFGALAASLMHLELFDAADAAAWAWFVALGAMGALSLLLLARRTTE